jgi:GTP diphosphokinase / guanosine-3',5'-bis(diphosphate) 3'-diphosphatase
MGPTSESVFLAQIQLEAFDRQALILDAARVLTDHQVRIVTTSTSTRRNRTMSMRFTLELADPTHLDRLLSAL